MNVWDINDQKEREEEEARSEVTRVDCAIEGFHPPPPQTFVVRQIMV